MPFGKIWMDLGNWFPPCDSWCSCDYGLFGLTEKTVPPEQICNDTIPLMGSEETIFCKEEWLKVLSPQEAMDVKEEAAKGTRVISDDVISLTGSDETIFSKEEWLEARSLQDRAEAVNSEEEAVDGAKCSFATATKNLCIWFFT